MRPHADPSDPMLDRLLAEQRRLARARKLRGGAVLGGAAAAALALALLPLPHPAPPTPAPPAGEPLAGPVDAAPAPPPPKLEMPAEPAGDPAPRMGVVRTTAPSPGFVRVLDRNGPPTRLATIPDPPSGGPPNVRLLSDDELLDALAAAGRPAALMHLPEGPRLALLPTEMKPR